MVAKLKSSMDLPVDAAVVRAAVGRKRRERGSFETSLGREEIGQVFKKEFEQMVDERIVVGRHLRPSKIDARTMSASSRSLLSSFESSR